MWSGVGRARVFDTKVSAGFWGLLRSLSKVSRLSLPKGLCSICCTLSVLWANGCLTNELFLEVLPPLNRECAEPKVSYPSLVSDLPAWPRVLFSRTKLLVST